MRSISIQIPERDDLTDMRDRIVCRGIEVLIRCASPEGRELLRATFDAGIREMTKPATVKTPEPNLDLGAFESHADGQREEQETS